MVKLPGPINVQTVATPVPNAYGANLDAPWQGLQDVGGALGNVGGQFAQMAERQAVEARRKAAEQQRLIDGTAITEGQIGYDRATTDEFTRLQTEGDLSNPDTLAIFDKSLSKQVGETLSSLSSSVSPLAREDLRLKLETRRNGIYQQAQVLSITDTKAKANKAYGDSTNSISSWAYRQPDRVDDWLMEVDDTLMNFAGALTPEQERAGRASGQIKVLDSAVRGFAERGDFNAARQLINDPRFDELFTPDQRQAMLDSALTLVEKRSTAEARVVEAQKEESASNLRVGIVAGKVGPAEITRALETRQIDNTQFDRLMNFAKTESPDADDGTLATDLRFSIYRGTTDMNDLMSYRGRLKGETLGSLMSLADQMGRRESVIERADVQRERRRADQIIGGVRGPLAVLDTAASERLANALDDFDQRVIKGENPREVSDSVIERFRQGPISLTALPRPKFWPGPVQIKPKVELDAQVAAAQRKTQQEFDAGRISQDEYLREMQTLQQYLEVVSGMEK